ncbi:MAG: hypothetical protein F4X92_03750 [Gammaproteobacteria bacterium]|nr:hypothetical protein [Gammaproteobacteria bacterium]
MTISFGKGCSRAEPGYEKNNYYYPLDFCIIRRFWNLPDSCSVKCP